MNSLWSHGFLDLDAEPMIVSLPDMNGRYVVMQALNMWTDNFASVGTRTNGGKAGHYLIAGPKWSGTAPKDVTATYRIPPDTPGFWCRCRRPVQRSTPRSMRSRIS